MGRIWRNGWPKSGTLCEAPWSREDGIGIRELGQICCCGVSGSTGSLYDDERRCEQKLCRHNCHRHHILPSCSVRPSATVGHVLVDRGLFICCRERRPRTHDDWKLEGWSFGVGINIPPRGAAYGFHWSSWYGNVDFCSGETLSFNKQLAWLGLPHPLSCQCSVSGSSASYTCSPPRTTTASQLRPSYSLHSISSFSRPPLSFTLSTLCVGAQRAPSSPAWPPFGIRSIPRF